MEKEKFYITTPIYYPSGKWHLGTCYTTVVCDALARFKRMQGYDVFYLTGTDEHGKKIQVKAEEAGVTPKEFVDGPVSNLKKLWKLLDISYDKFIRTTDDYHVKAASKIFDKLYEKGDIYKSEYEGMYCVPCESFWTKSQLKDGKCPDCGREVEVTHEESYFFRLSKYQDRIIDLIENNPDFLQPKSRQNEMLNNFLKVGLQDLAVSRTTFNWGIPVSFDNKHVMYVWVDALTNYITALGYMGDDDTLFKKFWPADVHMMGKEIIRFHSIIWPAILMALDLPLPKKVYGHGWLLFGNDKISKSKANTAVADPFILCDKYGVDAVRYFLLREVPFGADGSFTNSAFLTRINTDLCNDLGNLVSRTVSMMEQYFDGIVPVHGEYNSLDKEIISQAESLLPLTTKDMDELLVPDALVKIFRFVARLNKYIDETTPWVLNKTDEGKERLKTVMYTLAEGIRFVAVMLAPYLTKTAPMIMERIGADMKDLESFDSIKAWGGLKSGTKVVKKDHLFIRYDLEKELKVMAELAAPTAQPVKEEPIQPENTITVEEITIDDFDKVKLRVALVKACEKVPKADKLLKLTIDLGGEERTVVSGIAKYYTPEEMVGKEVILVSNLKPAKLRGIVSEGMILCAFNDDGEFSIIAPEKRVKSGTEVG